MRLLVLLLVPAFIGLVRSQRFRGQFADAPNFVGGSSGKGTVPPPDAPNNGPVRSHVVHGNVGAAPVGGSSRQFNPNPAAPNPGPIQGGFQHANQGGVQHANQGARPAPGQFGGSSGLADVPLGPVQTGVVDRVNMVNNGAAPVGGNQNSGEVFGDYGAGAQNGNGAANNAGRGEQVYNNAGGNSGNGGPAYAAGPYADGAGQGAPLGGAAISDLTQQAAGKGASAGAASVTSTVVGVVVAVLVLVGIVAVAAVFLVRQRQSRMTIASV